MKVIDCDQGGAEWFRARMGIPTASNFGAFLTTKGMLANSAAARRYALELVGERLTQRPAEHFATRAMDRGTELEPKARAWYQLVSGRSVKEVGFLLSDDGKCGSSPDGLCADRGIEIKCPMIATFIDTAESRVLPADHMAQVQAGMWITGLRKWDYVVFTDVAGLAPFVIEVAANDEMHAAFAESVAKFCEIVDAMESKLRTAGHGELPAPDEGPSWNELVGGRTVG